MIVDDISSCGHIYRCVTSGVGLSFLVEEEEMDRRHEQRFRRCENSLSDTVNSLSHGSVTSPRGMAFPCDSPIAESRAVEKFYLLYPQEGGTAADKLQSKPLFNKGRVSLWRFFPAELEFRGFPRLYLNLQKPDLHQGGETRFFLATAAKLSLPWKTSSVCVALKNQISPL